MRTQLADVTVHVDENLDAARRSEIEAELRALDGVNSIQNPDETPHLMVVRFDPDRIDTQAILSAVTDQGVHAELVGL